MIDELIAVVLVAPVVVDLKQEERRKLQPNSHMSETIHATGRQVGRQAAREMINRSVWRPK